MLPERVRRLASNPTVELGWDGQRLERTEIAVAFRIQARACAEHGSALYAALLERAAEDVEAGGPVAALLEGWEGHPLLDALALRLLGGIHRLVLAGEAPGLARHYPSAGGVADADAAWGELRALVSERAEALRPCLAEPVQTNEVRRSTVLLGGFLHVAARTGLPLRLLEIGSSAGLNLLFDRYAYDLSGARWGDPRSPVRLAAPWRGTLPPLAATLAVASRAGCDRSPLDVSDPAQRLRLESFLWPDQPERLALLRAAVAVAQVDPPRLARRSAAAWLGEVLAEPTPGCATVVFQSVVWLYFSELERCEVTRLVEAAGLRAHESAPLAWLRLEGADLSGAELRLRSWPGGEDRLLAHTDYHGREAEWLGGDTVPAPR